MIFRQGCACGYLRRLVKTFCLELVMCSDSAGSLRKKDRLGTSIRKSKKERQEETEKGMG